MPLITVVPKVGKRAPVGPLRPPQQPPTLDPEPEPDNQPQGAAEASTSLKTGWISPYVQQVRAGARPTRKRRWRYWLPGCRYWSQPR